MNSRKVILMIMDGWGLAEDPSVCAVHAAHTPFYDACFDNWPHTTLEASGEAVGLPEGQMGNSEVGHTNLGAGRVVYQELVRITRSLRTGEFQQREAWKGLLDYCRTTQKPLHLLGLVSEGGVHSHLNHLKGILNLLAQEENFPPVYIHVFTDGRDCDPRSGLSYVLDLENHLAETGAGKIASVIGRYYAMDRNQQYDRIALAWELLVHGKGKPFAKATEAIAASYREDITDEFLRPVVITENGQPRPRIQEGDAVLFFNFRTDRGRQLTQALSQRAFHEFNTHPLKLYYTTLTRYDESFQGVQVLFHKEDVSQGLGETLAAHGKTQIRIAETEKYPHVTFFFNGGREEPFPGESRILCPSPSVATYDLQPEMSALEIRDKIIPELEKGDVDFVCLNFANPDMVGHTGVFEAAVKAVETVDACVQAVAEVALRKGYAILLTADHGNVDKMLNPDGSPNTAHTTAKVPLFLLAAGAQALRLTPGKLGDIAPTILHLMGLPVPPVMTGTVLVQEKVTV